MQKVRFIALAVNKLSDTLRSSTLPISIYNHDRVDRACLYATRRHKMHGSLVVLFDHDKPTLLSKTRLLVKKQTWHNTHQTKCYRFWQMLLV